MQPLIPEGIRLSPHYYPAIKTGNTITTAGIVAVTPGDYVYAPYNAIEQTRFIIEILKKILAEGGATLDNVVMIRSYFPEHSYLKGVFEGLHEAFGDKIPPHTGVKIPSDSFNSGEGICVELEFLAITED